MMIRPVPPTVAPIAITLVCDIASGPGDEVLEADDVALEVDEGRICVDDESDGGIGPVETLVEEFGA
jgi:hypothetical protein